MSTQHQDVLIIGAGLSGIGAACHLSMKCPDKSVTILESRDALGGTWDLFRYPGIRSDSDMYTLGYEFKPWTNPKAIADGPAIRAYVEETAQEYGIDKLIRYGHKVVAANWSSGKSLWTVDVLNTATGKQSKFTCNFLVMCTGYYRYDAGYTPDFPGMKDFTGTIIHPQHWPEHLDYAGKKVVVIGSGATAVTLVPSMADTAGHVTMLQRSPSYVVTVPQEDIISNKLRGKLPEKLIYHAARARNVGLQMLVYRLSKRAPAAISRLLKGQVRLQVGSKVDMKHFSPSYNPWDERLCAVPNGDLFKALRSGKASVVTDHIEKFTPSGIELKSGDHLDADIIITATGLQLQLMGGVKLKVDGKVTDVSDSMAYKGLMFSNIPNAAMIFGYTNASWTLKADISADYICRLIKHMDKKGYDQCMPVLNDGDVKEAPFLDMKSGYIQRAAGIFPKQGDKSPWKLKQNYFFDLTQLRFGSVVDGVMRFSKGSQPASAQSTPQAELVAE